MRRGYTLVFFGWQADLLPGGDRVTMRVPVARNADGSPSPASCAARSWCSRLHLPCRWRRATSRCRGMHRIRPRRATTAPRAGWLPAAPDRAHARTRRAGGDPECPLVLRTCPAGQAATPSDTDICLEGGFQPGRLYELVYRARDPLVLGLGYAAMRDLPAFMRHARTDDAGRPNPLPRGCDHADPRHQPVRRNMRMFVHLGFNRDEAGRRAYDGMLPHVGGGLAAMNIRFAHPGAPGASRSTTSIPPMTSRFPTRV